MHVMRRDNIDCEGRRKPEKVLLSKMVNRPLPAAAAGGFRECPGLLQPEPKWLEITFQPEWGVRVLKADFSSWCLCISLFNCRVLIPASTAEALILPLLRARTSLR